MSHGLGAVQRGVLDALARYGPMNTTVRPVNREPPWPARVSPYRGRLANRGELKRG